MSVRQYLLCLVFIAVTISLGCGGGSSAQPNSTAHDFGTAPGQILYVINNANVSAYSIDPNSLAAAALGSPVSLLPANAGATQFDPSPDAHFLYLVWGDGQNIQHLSVFQTNSAGVPQLPAMQTLNADSLSQFNMHPSARFAYMLEITSANGLYQADIRLFHAQNDGTLTEDPQVQGSYGPAYYWPAFLYGFSADGSKLYDTSTLPMNSVYRQRPINLKTGDLGNDNQLISVNNETDVVIGKVIVDQYVSDSNANQGYVDVLFNRLGVRRAAVHCTAAMLSYCATATNVQLDPSSHYLFFTDPATQAVHIVFINLSTKSLNDTGNSIPMTSQTPGFVFSPDGTIVYAMLASDNRVHFYHFDHNSGVIMEAGTPLAITMSSGILPAQRR